MYLPPRFRCANPAPAHALMRAPPLASVVSPDGEGFPCVSHRPLPLYLHERAGAQALADWRQAGGRAPAQEA